VTKIKKKLCIYFKQILMYVSLFLILGNSISEDYGHTDVSIFIK
jgi:hypothetical protein